MATTETKTTKATKQTSAVNVEKTSSVEKENAELKKQMAEMQAQMDLLIKQMAIRDASPTPNVADDKKKITFVNMCKGCLVLRGSQIYTIEGQFNSRSFSKREASVIVSNMNKCVHNGKVYITDADFVQECGLSDAYENMLSNKELEELFNKDVNYIVDAYKMVSDGQKKIIVDMIADKRAKGLTVDGNVLIQISKLSGKDLMNIEPLEDE